MDNLLTGFKGALGQQAISMLGKQFGVQDTKANGIINMALPMLLSGLGKNAADENGAESLASALDKDHDGSIMDKLQDVLDGKEDKQEEGNKILKHIFGDKEPNVLGALEKSSGESSTNILGMLSTLAPLLMGFLGQQKKSQGLNAMDLAQMLQGQKQQADSELGGLSKLIDMDGDGSIMDDVFNIGKKFF